MTPSEGFQVIRPGSRPRTLWANGRGHTRELLRDAAGSWRLSLAEIGRDAPFSRLPGKDRILIVAEGEVLLRVAGDEHRLAAGEALEFSGDSEASATAVGDVALVVNLMVAHGDAEYRTDGAQLAERIEGPREDGEVVALLWRGVTLDGVVVEPGTLLVSSAWQAGSSDRMPASRLLRFPEPVVSYRLTVRSLS